jgi:hypothetical protein
MGRTGQKENMKDKQAGSGLAPGRMDPRSESDLEWYWCFGQALFERSTFGAVLERQALFGNQTKPCDVCGGSGFDENDDSCAECRGMGFVVTGRVGKRSADVQFSTRKCPDCRIPKKVGSKRVSVDDCPDCKTCHGKGYVEQQPAVCAKSDKSDEIGYEPDDGALRRYAKVSRRLEAFTAAHPEHAEVLRLYYGTDGLRWGRTKWGRLYSCIPLTAAGRKLLHGTPNPQELNRQQLFANIVNAQDQSSSQAKAGAILSGVHQAAKLYAAACAAWMGKEPSPEAEQGAA